FHEGNTLQAAVEAYRERYGHYPEAVLADRAYRNSGESALLQRAWHSPEWTSAGSALEDGTGRTGTD
ncbi:hypothetical protein SAMN05421543_12740, partial [Alicyclobacillus macrosporangiidus]